MRNKITFAYEFIGGIAVSIISIIGGLLLNVIKIQNAFLIVGLASLAIMIVVLDYMRTRFGLKPEEYKKEDIEFNPKTAKCIYDKSKLRYDKIITATDAK